MNAITISLNAAEQRFETTVDGVTAYITFERSDNTIAYTHTIVPEAIGGRGIAGQLAQHALEYAKAQGLKVKPECSYVRAYIGKHPEYQDLIN